MRKLILKWLFGEDLKEYYEMLQLWEKTLNSYKECLEKSIGFNEELESVYKTIIENNNRSSELIKTSKELMELNDALVARIDKLEEMRKRDTI